jgi:hypothetical protein
MKWFLILWITPLVLLGSWYGLSYHDMHFGFFMLTRETHELVFQIYGNVLGIEPERIPPLVMRALIVDTFLVLGIIAFRRRRQIAAWWRDRRAKAEHRTYAEPLRDNVESLSSAP